MRHRSLLFLLASFMLILGALLFPRSVLAVCRIGSGGAHSVTATLQGNRITVNGKSFDVPDSQCKPPGRQPNGTYTISCDERTEVNARDSIVAPLCGASVELEKTNSTCWFCENPNGGGDLKCAGASFAVGNSTESLFSQSNREGIPGNNINETWRVKNAPGSFEYNGHPYTLNEFGASGIVMCNSNVVACGIDESAGVSCHNALFPEVTIGKAAEDAIECKKIDANGNAVGDDQIPMTPADHGVAPGDAGQQSCAAGSTVRDIEKYIMPCTGDEECKPINASSFPKDFSWVGAVNNRVAGYTPDAETARRNGLKPGSRYSIQHSNGQHLLYSVGPDGIIRLVEDTTWTNSETCENGGKAALQRLYTPDAQGNLALGAAFAKTSMKCGETITNNARNKAFGYNNDTPLDSTAVDCGNTQKGHAGQLNSTNKLIFQGPITCNGQRTDAIAMEVTGGAGTGEVFVFCKNQGLCAWFQDIDFSDPNKSPNTWTSGTDVCSGIGLIDISSSDWACEQDPQTLTRFSLPHLTNWLDGTTVVYDRVQAPGNEGVGETFPKDNQVNTPNLTKESQELYTAAQWMESTNHKRTIQDITHTFDYSANTKVCYPTTENDNKMNVADTGIIRWAANLLNIGLTGSAETSTYYGTNRMAKSAQNLNVTHPKVSVNVRNVPPCETPPDHGDSVLTMIANSLNLQNYRVPESEWPLHKVLTWFTQAKIDEILTCVLSGTTDCELLETDTQAYLDYHIYFPHANKFMEYLTRDPITSLPVGILNIFRNNTIQRNKRVATMPQTVAQSVGSNGEPLITDEFAYDAAAGIAEAVEQTNCTLIGSQNQRKRGMICTGFDGTTNTSIPQTSVTGTHTWEEQEPDVDPERERPLSAEDCEYRPVSDKLKPDSATFMTALKAAAQKEKIPECILAGVAQIEGGGRTAEKPLAQCKPSNSCSATGPMQFTTGPQAGIDCTQCEAGYCPNAWAIYGKGLDNPCNYEDSLVAAARLLKISGLSGSNWEGQESRIEQSGTNYYGSSKKLCQVRDDQDNLRSYGEFLVDYCKNY